ncbi:MAG: NAD(P)-dependent oxidoreductase [Kofleriaceae bacterium]|nr:NAD(P)-dependent oxidoreductase [Kofleriaceae bacterium]
MTIKSSSANVLDMKRLGRVAITGATGFIGSALALACLKQGDEVTALVRSESEISRMLETAGARIVVGDLSQKQALDALCDDAQVVLHCAAYMAKGDRAKSDEVNIVGTQNLLESADKQKVGLFLYVSSISVYRGTDSSTRVFTEENQPYLHPGLNNYSRSKLEGEHVVTEYCESREMDYLIVRPTNVYGQGCKPWGSDVKSFVKKFHLSFGNVAFNFIHIDDLVRGMLDACESKEASNHAFNLGAEMIPLREFYESVAKEHGVSVVRIPGPIDAAIRHGVDFYARMRKEVRSTGYSVHSHYPHDKSTELFGYNPTNFVLKH